MKWAGSRGRHQAAFRHFRALLLLGAMLAIAGCRKPADSPGDISVSESITPQPVRVGKETVSIVLRDPARQLVAHARIQVEGDMDHPGMAPVFSDAVETAPGVYEAPLTFTMGGDWVVLLHVTLVDGRKIEGQMYVKGVESR
jgi:hypothetical protein